MSDLKAWYVVKQDDGKCAILPESQVSNAEKSEPAKREQWGPYASQQEAIARRVGLIRAGKCNPV